jgi:hypothetical protein
LIAHLTFQTLLPAILIVSWKKLLFQCRSCRWSTVSTKRCQMTFSSFTIRGRSASKILSKVSQPSFLPPKNEKLRKGSMQSLRILSVAD